MFLLVALAQGSDRGFDLGDVAAPLDIALVENESRGARLARRGPGSYQVKG